MCRLAAGTLLLLVLGAGRSTAAEQQPSGRFAGEIRPVLQRYCADCHDADAGSDVAFAAAEEADALAQARSLWSSVAHQLRNRTMPPADEPQPSEGERLQVARWIERTLRETACEGGEFAGQVIARRMNRREYAHTIRDLVGVELGLAEQLPVDSGGGEGFDNNGETMFLPPLLLERYLEAAQQIVDAAIVSPPLDKRFGPADLFPRRESSAGTFRILAADGKLTALLPIWVDGEYEITLEAIVAGKGKASVAVAIDGIEADQLTFRSGGDDPAPPQQTVVQLKRGLHSVSLLATDAAETRIKELRVRQQADPPTDRQRATHRRLLGVPAGEVPEDPLSAARQQLRKFVRRAFRRPVEEADLNRFLQLYRRAAERGDPFEEQMKLAIKGVLVSPDFLFRIEQPPDDGAMTLLTDHELASRLSYFLWSTMPDDELLELAGRGQLNDPQVIGQQVERMLRDPKADAFYESFVGQWLGTRDVGGSVAPTDNGIQDFYTPDIATDMRREAILLFQHIVQENRDLRELIDADYTFVTGRLAKFYGIPDAGKLKRDEFQKVLVPDGRRGGVLGLGAVLALTSHTASRETSPVLRGAWVLDTLLGTPVPSPPPDIPEIDKSQREKQKLTVRQALQAHRDHAACAPCHDLIDPIGFGLENFDFVGRWRDEEAGKPIDATGTMPSGESFDGLAELRHVLLNQRQAFARQLSRKLLGYALGRSLVDDDLCTIEQLIGALENGEYRANALFKTVALSTPFRYKQGPPSSSAGRHNSEEKDR